MLKHGEEIQAGEVQKVLIAGTPKDSGKTTTALSFGLLGPLLDFQFDFGSPSVPPGVPKENLYIKTYEAATPEFHDDTDVWKPAKNVGAEIIRDVAEVRNAFRENRPVVIDGVSLPLPKTIVLDGGVGLADSILDWILVMNNKNDTEEFVSGFTPYKKRLSKLGTIYRTLIPLPCNVVIITWMSAEMKSEKVMGRDGKMTLVSSATGRYLPDLGGKLDIQGAGLVDTSLRAYSMKTPNGTKFMVSYRGGETYPGLGIRGRYDRGEDIDVTISKEHPSLPYERIFGRLVKR